MRKFFKWLFIGLGSLVGILLLICLFLYIKWSRESSDNLSLLGPEAKTSTENSHTFRDLNKNGRLDAYEDIRQPMEVRVENLLGQMNLDEKAGLLFITMIPISTDGTLSEVPGFSNPFSFLLNTSSEMVARKKMNHFNSIQSLEPALMVTWHNALQKMAERTRLGIPVTMATDPRHGAGNNIGTGIPTEGFSKWPSPLGFGAIGDTVLMRDFGNIARQEYRALGFRLALSPQSDLSTEPRWGRNNGTFGEDADLTAGLVKAYILGFQGDSVGHESVACEAKHFPGVDRSKMAKIRILKPEKT